jgi:hypothetical protein
MPLQKTQFRPGVNRENTRYTNEGGWYESDKVRFRQGTPEKIGGWTQFSSATFNGTCRSLWTWTSLSGINYVGVGTHLKFYVEEGAVYYDQTPVRASGTLTNPFSVASVGTSTVTVTDANHGCDTGAYVVFSGAGLTGLGGNITASVLTGEFQVTVLSSNQYTIEVPAISSSADVSGSPGGGTLTVQRLLNPGPEIQVPLSGWGASSWGSGSWGLTTSTNTYVSLQLWNQYNYGEDLIFGPRGGALYYWDASVGTVPVSCTVSVATPAVVTPTVGHTFANGMAIRLTTTGALPTGLSVGTTYFVVNATSTTFQLSATFGGAAINTTGATSGTTYIDCRGIPLTTIGDSSTPVVHNSLTISDTSRFVIVFGTNDYGSTTMDPMLIRWSDQENYAVWYPQATNQAGSIRLSHGSKIVTTVQSRQEIVVLTDSSVYSMQYIGPPYVWSTQLLGDNISIAGPNAVALASGVTYWMGRDKFYVYDGRVNVLNCDLRKYVFSDINLVQQEQIFCGTNEGFNEVWWFYCSKNSTTIDKYVVFNYLERCWYYGTIARTAWMDSGLLPYPVAADYNNRLLNHENGVDDVSTGTVEPIEAFISSSEFDINDGHNFGFVWRALPDLSFEGSTEGSSPELVMTLYPMRNSGSGVGTAENATVTGTGTPYTITENFTGQVYTRVRGRQLIFKVSSNKIGTTWQFGSPRFDIKPDGRR